MCVWDKVWLSQFLHVDTHYLLVGLNIALMSLRFSSHDVLSPILNMCGRHAVGVLASSLTVGVLVVLLVFISLSMSLDLQPFAHSVVFI